MSSSALIAAQTLQSNTQMTEQFALQASQSALTHEQTLATIAMEGVKQRENQLERSLANMRDADAQTENANVTKAGQSSSGG